MNVHKPLFPSSISVQPSMPQNTPTQGTTPH